MDQGACLFEASAEFARDPTFPEHRSVPAAKRRDDEQGRLFFAYFLLDDSQKKVSSRRATPGKQCEGELLLNKELLKPVFRAQWQVKANK